MQRALRFIYSNHPRALAKPNTAEELEAIELVLNTYDLIAFRIRKKVVPKRDVIETEWQVLHRIWKQLEAFVRSERLHRGDDQYKRNLQWLVECAREHQVDNHPAGLGEVFRRELLDLKKGLNTESEVVSIAPGRPDSAQSPKRKGRHKDRTA